MLSVFLLTSISVIIDLISSEKSISKFLSFFIPLGVSVSPNHLAIIANDVPCTNKETSVHKNTILKMVRASGTFSLRTKTAKIIGTAPFNPTHET